MKTCMVLLGGLLLLSVKCFAAYQFNETIIGDFRGTPIAENYLTFDGNTDIYLDFDDHLTGFGYYDLETGMMTEGKIVSKEDDGDTLGYLGSFTEQDKIGIWIKTGYGKGSKFYTSTNLKLPGTNNRFIGTETDIDLDDDDDQPEVEFTIGTHFDYDRGDREWELDGIEFEIIGPHADAPSGQPLPGSLATLIFAGVAGCLYKRKQGK